MEITWHGMSCFRLKERNLPAIVTDPYNGDLGLPPLKLRGEVVTISHDAPGHNYTAAVSGYQYALTGPGEYEIGGVFITGIATAHEARSTQNVLFLFDFDGITVAHLGDMSQVPSQTEIEALELVNVLLVPVGGQQPQCGPGCRAGLHARTQHRHSHALPVPELKLPLDGVERFLNEMGVTEAKEESTLRVSGGTFGEETEVVLLQPRFGA